MLIAIGFMGGFLIVGLGMGYVAWRVHRANREELARLRRERQADPLGEIFED